MEQGLPRMLARIPSAEGAESAASAAGRTAKYPGRLDTGKGAATAARRLGCDRERRGSRGGERARRYAPGQPAGEAQEQTVETQSVLEELARKAHSEAVQVMGLEAWPASAKLTLQFWSAAGGQRTRRPNASWAELGCLAGTARLQMLPGETGCAAGRRLARPRLLQIPCSHPPLSFCCSSAPKACSDSPILFNPSSPVPPCRPTRPPHAPVLAGVLPSGRALVLHTM